MSERELIKPGVHSLEAERYFAAQGVSMSDLDILADATPLHLWASKNGEEIEKETEAKTFGNILHRGMLEPDSYKSGFYVRPPGLNFTTKEGKSWRAAHTDKPTLTFKESKQVIAMVESVYRCDLARSLLAGASTEQSLFVEDENGVLRKSRLDALTTGNVIPDIKTIGFPASKENFDRAVKNYRYHARAAYYLDNCRMVGIEKQIFMFIVVEKLPPYAVRCFQLNPDLISVGRVAYQTPLQTYRECLATGKWPGWNDINGFEIAELPAWEMKQIENAYGG